MQYEGQASTSFVPNMNFMFSAQWGGHTHTHTHARCLLYIIQRCAASLRKIYFAIAVRYDMLAENSIACASRVQNDILNQHPGAIIGYARILENILYILHSRRTLAAVMLLESASKKKKNKRQLHLNRTQTPDVGCFPRPGQVKVHVGVTCHSLLHCRSHLPHTAFSGILCHFAL